MEMGQPINGQEVFPSPPACKQGKGQPPFSILCAGLTSAACSGAGVQTGALIFYLGIALKIREEKVYRAIPLQTMAFNAGDG
ncbi:hypothetical protein [Chitinibacter sp. GC72]|uniref:hypothetical protein n=1 Tax=Chitinibacter sp. GC72 TaxID=1526917 RepID=UPI0012F7552C|nr:hypothetical protein [Chitinibacter sp. GC72]